MLGVVVEGEHPGYREVVGGRHAAHPASRCARAYVAHCRTALHDEQPCRRVVADDVVLERDSRVLGRDRAHVGDGGSEAVDADAPDHTLVTPDADRLRDVACAYRVACRVGTQEQLLGRVVDGKGAGLHCGGGSNLDLGDAVDPDLVGMRRKRVVRVDELPTRGGPIRRAERVRGTRIELCRPTTGHPRVRGLRPCSDDAAAVEPHRFVRVGLDRQRLALDRDALVVRAGPDDDRGSRRRGADRLADGTERCTDGSRGAVVTRHRHEVRSRRDGVRG